MKVCPAIVSVPVRGLPVVFTATLYFTVPFPLPDAPDVMVSHGSLLVACHGQLANVETITVPVPPSDANESLVGIMTKGGLEAVEFAVEELLPLTGSRSNEVTDAVLLTFAPFATEQLNVAMILIVAEVPDASELNETVRLLPEPPHRPPPVDEHDTNARDDGRLSVTVIDEAGSGPLFVTVIVYVTSFPAMMLAAVALVMAISAAPYVTHAENSEVFPCEFVAVAVMDWPGEADPATVTLNVALPFAAVVVVAEPRNVCPSPLPDASQDAFE